MQEHTTKYSFLPVLVVLGLYPLAIENALVVLLIALASILIFNSSRDDHILFGVMLAGFFARAIVAIIDDKFAILPYGWDDYYTTALQIKENLQSNYPIFNDIHKSIHLKSYSTFNAILNLIFGNWEITIRLFNSLLGVLVAERIYRICQVLNLNRRTAQLAAIFTAFWPSFILFNSLNMRDTLIVFLSIDMLFRFISNVERVRFINIFIIVFELAFLFTLRIQNILVYASVFAGYILYTRVFKGSFRNILKPIPILVIIVAVISFLYISHSFDGLLRYLNVEMQFRTTGGSAYLPGQVYNSWWDVIKFAPIRFFYFCFGPFPWQVRNGFMMLAFVESIFFFFSVVIAIKAVLEKKILMSSAVVLLILFAVLGLAANALIDSNYGTAIRHKMNYIIVFFIFAAAYLNKIRYYIL